MYCVGTWKDNIASRYSRKKSPREYFYSWNNSGAIWSAFEIKITWLPSSKKLFIFITKF